MRIVTILFDDLMIPSTTDAGLFVILDLYVCTTYIRYELFDVVGCLPP